MSLSAPGKSSVPVWMSYRKGPLPCTRPVCSSSLRGDLSFARHCIPCACWRPQMSPTIPHLLRPLPFFLLLDWVVADPLLTRSCLPLVASAISGYSLIYELHSASVDTSHPCDLLASLCSLSPPIARCRKVRLARASRYLRLPLVCCFIFPLLLSLG